MTCVWKFLVPRPTALGESFIDVPVGGRLLSVGSQGPHMVVWGTVVPDAPVQSRRLVVVNTGQGLPGFPETARFLGTVTYDWNVWHVWDADA